MESNIVVIGGANIDVCAKSDSRIIYRDSNIGKVEFALGGVGRNIAEDLCLFGADTSLLTAIGNDSFGRVVSDNAYQQNFTLLEKPFKNAKTGVYAYMPDNDGSFVVGVNDMEITSMITPQIIEKNINALYFADYVLLEANLPEPTIDKICSYDFKLVADSVSGLKCVRLRNVINKLYLLKANLIELVALTGKTIKEDGVRELVRMGLKRGIVTLGKDGAMCFEVTEEGICCYELPNLENHKIVDTSGCGDAFLAGFMMGIMRGHSMSDCLYIGQSAACLNAESFSSVNRDMSYTKLKEVVSEFKKKTQIKKDILK